MMKNMSPEHLKSMSEMAMKMHGGNLAPPATASSTSRPATATTVAAPAGRAAAVAPSLPAGTDMAGIAEMMGSLPPEQMAEMMKMSGMPAGMEMSPDMLKVRVHCLVLTPNP